MGLLSWTSRQARLAVDGEQLSAAAALPSMSTLETVRGIPEAAAAFGINVDQVRVTRAEAMAIPAVRRGRQVICGTLGTLALVAHREGPGGVEDVTSERQLLQQPDPNTTRQHTLTWTFDDLLFHGLAWWHVLARDAQSYPTRAERVAPDRVVARPGVRPRLDGREVEDRDLIRFDGPDEGMLAYGGRTLRTSQLLEEAARKYARLDVPMGVLKLAEGAAELTDDEVDQVLDRWEEKRRTRTTAYLNRALDYQVLQFDAQKVQLAEARQHQAAEAARLLNLAPRYVNAPNASGMTYTNVESERRDLVDTSLVGYIAAVEQRLSLGDVTPRGTTVRLDLTRLMAGDQLTALQAAQLAVGLRAMTPAEVRTDVLGRPPLPELPDAPPAQEAPA